MTYLWREDSEFAAFEITFDQGRFCAEFLLEGRIDTERSSAFDAGVFAQMDEVAKTLSAGRSASLSEVEPGHKPNFVFIRSLLDYQSIGTSDSLELAILDIYRKSPFLFEPSSSFWNKAA